MGAEEQLISRDYTKAMQCVVATSTKALFIDGDNGFVLHTIFGNADQQRRYARQRQDTVSSKAG